MTSTQPAAQTLLQVQDLSRSGLEPVRLELRRGECLAILGPSGSGKSLLLRAIADLDPNEGEAFLEGRARSAMSGPEWRRRIVYLSAEPAWWSDSVAEHMPDPESAAALLPPMNLPSDALSWSVKRLSTGEKQRLAVARALSLKPAVLLADEPTAALDQATTTAVEAVLSEHMLEGMGLVLVTHAQAQAERVANRVLIMDSGRLREPCKPT